jgi:hypothetical protein
MNIRKLTIAVTLLAGTIGIGGTSARADSVISKNVSAAGSYRHMKFLAMREETLGGTNQRLTTTDDLVDFYGSCDRDPLGQDEIQAQRIESQHRFNTDYED